METFGVYTRASDIELWKLNYVTNHEAAKIAEALSEHFGVSAMIVGPLRFFPVFLEA